MEAGLAGTKMHYASIVDRTEAIRCAVHEARPGDTVLIAGKGHETYQIFKDSVVPFDDCLVAREALDGKEPTS